VDRILDMPFDAPERHGGALIPKPVRVAVIGAGAISQKHLLAYTGMGDVARVVAIAEQDPERRAIASRRYPAVDTVPDYAGLLDRSDIDLVDICTPPAGHAEIVVDALAADKSVVCEKPLAPTLEEIDRIRGVEGSHPGEVGTIYQYRMMPEIREMIRLRTAGELGDLLFGNFTDFDRVVGGPMEAKDWWGEWRTAGGGVGMTQFIHRLDLMCLLFGRPVEVTAMMGTLGAPIESEDSLSATIRFESGAIVGGSATMTARRSAFRVDVVGTRGSVHYPWALFSDHLDRSRPLFGALGQRARPDSRPGVLTRGLRRAQRTLKVGGTIPTNHSRFLRAVVTAVARGRPVPVSLDQARQSVELCTAIYASALSRSPVTLPLASTSPFYRGVSASDYSSAIGTDTLVTKRRARPA
jgi:UDP-N-acetyl-2-amino-2-deoxyglucuronate dehydrogenase